VPKVSALNSMASEPCCFEYICFFPQISLVEFHLS
jgi:hypothetical protein